MVNISYTTLSTKERLKIFAMRLVILALATAAGALAASSDKPEVKILTEKNVVSANGYDFGFETSDGVTRKEEGRLITVGEHQGIGVKGSYSYKAPDGLTYEVIFSADDKGFKPSIRVSSP